jgi:hypothetical protein
MGKNEDLGYCIAGEELEPEYPYRRPDWCPLVVETPLNRYKNVAGDYDVEIGGTIPSIESEE